MPPILALILTFGFIIYLFKQDKHHYSGISGALWIPLILLFIMATRLPSGWLSLQVALTTAQAYEEGNAFDRLFYMVLIGLCLIVLSKRGAHWSQIFRSNWALVLFVGYCLLSVSWSDYPMVAFKRWFRDLSLYLTILVTMTERQPLEALSLLFRRMTYLVIPLSVTTIKYFPEMGVQYSIWNGAKSFTGIASGKNGLGCVCLVSGLCLVWDMIRSWRKGDRNRAAIFVNLLLLAMLMWLFSLSDSKTSQVSFLVGVLMLLVFQLKTFRQKPGRIIWVVVLVAMTYVTLNFAVGLDSMIYRAAGRDDTLTGRTDLWDDIRQVNDSHILGTGYESFWLGDRLIRLTAMNPWAPNQAHNGYLETYINLGLVGLSLLLFFLFVTLLKIRASLFVEFQLGLIALVLLITTILYNFTEAAFHYRANWYAFLALGMAAAHFALIKQPGPVVFVRRPSVSFPQFKLKLRKT